MRPVDPIRVNERDRKAARSSRKMEFGDGREPTADGVHPCAREEAGVVQRDVAISACTSHFMVLRGQAHPL
eukprot:4379315-Pleurochrysis_carterae.AAC.1